MIQGSCQCGKIVYQVEAIPEHTYNCHCSACRKAHGATFATQLFAKGETLTFLQGEDLLSEYVGEVGIRTFCSNCGTRLMNYAADKSHYLSVALASVEGDHGIVPVAHCNVESKALWHEPSEDIPLFQGFPDGI
ncbi:MAG: GFA family protein [Pseudomonadales bacterium]|nr:GFA family protein [Pseudomonadales bacterium]